MRGEVPAGQVERSGDDTLKKTPALRATLQSQSAVRAGLREALLQHGRVSLPVLVENVVSARLNRRGCSRLDRCEARDDRQLRSRQRGVDLARERDRRAGVLLADHHQRRAAISFRRWSGLILGMAWQQPA